MRRALHKLTVLGRVVLRYATHRALGVTSAAETIPAPQVINLPHRKDRRAAVSKEFAQHHLDGVFVQATKDSNGPLGCAISHRNLLKSAPSDSTVWVCEDDVAFEGTPPEISDGGHWRTVVTEFLGNDRLDVLCLAHKTLGPVWPVSKHLALTTASITTASYLVKPGAKEHLIRCFDQSVAMLALGQPPHIAAHDVHWLGLQRESLVFCVPRQPVVYQAPSYSDIQETDVDYYGRQLTSESDQ
jgi:hypothetical protein